MSIITFRPSWNNQSTTRVVDEQKVILKQFWLNWLTVFFKQRNPKIYWFQPCKLEDFLLSCVLYDSKFYILGFWTVFLDKTSNLKIIVSRRYNGSKIFQVKSPPVRGPTNHYLLNWLMIRSNKCQIACFPDYPCLQIFSSLPNKMNRSSKSSQLSSWNKGIFGILLENQLKQ